MPRFFNPYVYPNNMSNNQNVEQNEQMLNQQQKPCCLQGNQNFNNQCPKGDCPTIYKECPPIVTCSKQVLNQYHITKQPYVHNYHTEVVHHYITQNEFIPTYTCSAVHLNEQENDYFPPMNNNQ